MVKTVWIIVAASDDNHEFGAVIKPQQLLLCVI